MARRYRRSKPSLAAVLVVIAVLVIAALVRGAGSHGTTGATDSPSADASVAAQSPEVTPDATASAAPTPAAPTPASTDAAGYLAQLDGLTVGSVTAAGYARAQFGDGWKDTDHNGCDSRNDVLARDLQSPTFRAGTHDCVVLTGVLHDPYTGKTIDFVRGDATSEAVQIDHLVPLSWSWSHGAASWTAEQRVAFANDPLELRAVDGPTNGAKSDSGPADWMPPRASFACGYVEAFIAVLSTYRLSVDRGDLVAMRAVLSTC